MGIYGYSPLHKGNIYTAKNLKLCSGLEQDQLGSIGPGHFVFAMKLHTKEWLGFGCYCRGFFTRLFHVSKPCC